MCEDMPQTGLDYVINIMDIYRESKVCKIIYFIDIVVRNQTKILFDWRLAQIISQTHSLLRQNTQQTAPHQ